MSECPCGSGKSYAACCGPLHAGAAIAPTAEALMRSRYSAYGLGLEPYLLATWHVSTRPAALHLAGRIAARSALCMPRYTPEEKIGSMNA